MWEAPDTGRLWYCPSQVIHELKALPLRDVLGSNGYADLQSVVLLIERVNWYEVPSRDYIRYTSKKRDHCRGQSDKSGDFVWVDPIAGEIPADVEAMARRSDRYAKIEEPSWLEREYFHIRNVLVRGFVEVKGDADPSPPRAELASTFSSAASTHGTSGSANGTTGAGYSASNSTATLAHVGGKRASPEQEETRELSSEDESPAGRLPSPKRLRYVVQREMDKRAAGMSHDSSTVAVLPPVKGTMWYSNRL